MPRASENGKSRTRRAAPALTPEDREDQLISLAIDMAEQKLLDGTASNQLIVHYLKLGSVREKLEREKIKKENDLLDAKAESYRTAANVEELYKKAIDAMVSYKGGKIDEDEDY